MVLKISWSETSRVAEWTIIPGCWAGTIIYQGPEVTRNGRDLDRYSTQHVRNFLDFQDGKDPETSGIQPQVQREAALNRNPDPATDRGGPSATHSTWTEDSLGLPFSSVLYVRLS